MLKNKRIFEDKVLNCDSKSISVIREKCESRNKMLLLDEVEMCVCVHVCLPNVRNRNALINSSIFA